MDTNKYPTESAAVVDLHNKGFVNDFQLLGNHLLWIQGKVFIDCNNITILECNRVNNGKNHTEMILFGITVFPYNEKGILINRMPNYRIKPPVYITKKLKEAGLTQAWL